MLALEDSFDIEFPDGVVAEEYFRKRQGDRGCVDGVGCCMNAPQSQCSTGTALERAARLADEVASGVGRRSRCRSKVSA